jgi:hypothetical protein
MVKQLFESEYPTIRKTVSSLISTLKNAIRLIKALDFCTDISIL